MTTLNIKEWIPFIMIMSTYTAIGIPTNLIIIKYYPLKSKTGILTNYFIKILAFTDLLTCCFAIPVTACLDMGLLRDRVSCKLCMSLTYGFISCSFFLFGSISLERWFSLYHPHVLTKKHIFGLTICSLILSLVAACLTGFYFDVEQEDSSKKTCTFTNEHGRIIVGVIFSIVFFSVITVIIICYTTIFFAAFIRYRSSKKVVTESLRRATTSKIQTRYAVMLLFVTMIFLLSWIPFWLEYFGVMKKQPILNSIIFIENFTNCFIYLIFQRNFRLNVKNFMKEIGKKFICTCN